MSLIESLDTAKEHFLVKSIGAETKSGSRIEKLVDNPSSTKSQEIIFKEGHHSKLQIEKEKLKEWQKILPGMTPLVHDYIRHSVIKTYIVWNVI